ncbi:TIGR03557 family F420-dependent LLM class oxidoreductase [Catellatospora sp. KI3]|uniref:TIGR03557 family F420-dependent LLM class oxidoreductase n=1 Tax=Catellatospora sp. KI3 TaxID=3041620 RepID=UPI00248277BA|nr:TIGR03557 family F420-dependent LLM class oxidoreductase [Catellatospora sp. KI3]MDI1463181.1 TIGR03557 family F420-dependent LLM class oxidoreductase [Catellatospora sp. KI3]
MANIGYTLMCEQRGPRDLVDDAVRAEAAGFDFAVCSDHYYPWLPEQGHAPYAWAVLGAAAYATERIGLMSFVTCPIQRYHPAVVAQKAATVGVMSGGRFTLGLGAGENLNEHVAGGWPHTTQRHHMLDEALEIIRPLLEGKTVHHSGVYFDVPDAKLWDLPEQPVPIGVAVSGRSSCELAARHADALVAVEPDPKLIEMYREAGGRGPCYGQVALCYGPDEQECARIAHEQFRWFNLGWKVMAELPHPRSFHAAAQSTTPDQVAEQIPCGPDLDRHVEAVQKFVDAGFTDVAVVQIGGDTQPEFLDVAQKELLPALNRLSPSARP